MNVPAKIIVTGFDQNGKEVVEEYERDSLDSNFVRLIRLVFGRKNHVK